MYVTWGLLSFLMIVTGRYMKQFYRIRIILHAVLGTLILGLTIFFIIYLYNDPYAKPLTQIRDRFLHLKFGFVTRILAYITCGIGALYMIVHVLFNFSVKTTSLAWALGPKLLRFIHIVFGYFIIFFANFTCFSGMYSYGLSYKNVIFLHFFSYIVGLAILEIIHQCRWKNREYNEGGRFKYVKRQMTLDEFHHGIAAGESWALYNNYVIDLSVYQFEHPGGRFLIHRCIGQDLGHYLNGSATNVDSYPGKGRLSRFMLEGKPHEHSRAAYDITAKLAIAKLRMDHTANFLTDSRFSRDTYKSVNVSEQNSVRSDTVDTLLGQDEEFGIFNVTRKTELTPMIYRYTFSS